MKTRKKTKQCSTPTNLKSFAPDHEIKATQTDVIIVNDLVIIQRIAQMNHIVLCARTTDITTETVQRENHKKTTALKLGLLKKQPRKI